jgi:5-methylcytosine-specific restriction enzyme A
MKFSPLQKAFFAASDGAYSIVTGDERRNSQITISEADGESQIVIDQFGPEQIPRLAIKGRRLPISIYNSETKASSDSEIGINYPKSEGNELRIYRNAEAGFNYQAGDFWFVFTREGRLHVGSMPEPEWRSIGTGDYNDSIFQEAVECETSNEQESQFVDFAGTRIKRDPNIARQAIIDSDYCCAFTEEPTPFISKRTGRPYLEAHHLIPLGLEPQLNISLDVLDNVVALNPLWHRAIHHASPEMVCDILGKLVARREGFLASHSIDLQYLIRLYGCEAIRVD